MRTAWNAPIPRRCLLTTGFRHARNWMRTVSFAGLHRLLKAVAGTSGGLRAREMNALVFDRRVTLTPRRAAPKPTTLYHYRNTLVRPHEVEGVPLRQLLVERRPQRRAATVLRPGRAVAADPLLAGAAGLRPNGLPPLADHREELLAHLPGLRLDRAAVDDPAAVREGARPVAPRHRARRLLPRRADDLEPTDPAFRARSGAGAGDETDAGPVRGETPVRGEGGRGRRSRGRRRCAPRGTRPAGYRFRVPPGRRRQDAFGLPP